MFCCPTRLDLELFRLGLLWRDRRPQPPKRDRRVNHRQQRLDGSSIRLLQNKRGRVGPIVAGSCPEWRIKNDTEPRASTSSWWWKKQNISMPIANLTPYLTRCLDHISSVASLMCFHDKTLREMHSKKTETNHQRKTTNWKQRKKGTAASTTTNVLCKWWRLILFKHTCMKSGETKESKQDHHGHDQPAWWTWHGARCRFPSIRTRWFPMTMLVPLTLANWISGLGKSRCRRPSAVHQLENGQQQHNQRRKKEEKSLMRQSRSWSNRLLHTHQHTDRHRQTISPNRRPLVFTLNTYSFLRWRSWRRCSTFCQKRNCWQLDARARAPTSKSQRCPVHRPAQQS